MHRICLTALCSSIALQIAGSAVASGFSETILTASDAAAGRDFGNSVSKSGGRIAIGAPLHDGMGQAAGAAYVFEAGYPAGGVASWVEVAKRFALDAEPNDSFGHSVSIDQATLVVGAPGEGDPGLFSGAAYVFERDLGGAGSWSEAKKLEASDSAQLDQFGISVAISGDTIVVGAHQDEDAGSFTGSAYVFARDAGGSGNWGEVKKLMASDASADHHFGFAVAISGDTIVVGAYGDDDNGMLAGAAYVFERDVGGADNWGEAKKLVAPDGVNFDQFGSAVAIDGDELVAGMFSDDEPFHKSGSAYVFERGLGASGSWGLREKIAAADAGELDWFGRAVAIRHGRVASGAYNADTNVVVAGSAYLFERDSGGASSWGEASKLVASDAAQGDRFGISVAVDHDAIVIGADAADAVYVYQASPTELPVGPASGSLLLEAALLVTARRHLCTRRMRPGAADEPARA